MIRTASLLGVPILLSAALAHAGVNVYSGNDAGAGSTSPRPNSANAAARFDAAARLLGAASIVTFEAAPLGSFDKPLLVAPGVTVGVGASIRNTPDTPEAAYGYNATPAGTRWLSLTGGSLTFTFSRPTKAFGAYFSGIQAGGETITFNDGSLQSVSLPNLGERGGIAFVGFTDTIAVSSITIHAPGDLIGIDDIRFLGGTGSPVIGKERSGGLNQRATVAYTAKGSLSLPVILTAADLGWYESNGSFSGGPAPANYLAGSDTTSCLEARNFFTFNLASVTGTILSGQLQVYIPGTSAGDAYNGFSSPNSSDTYQLFDVSTPLQTLVGGTGGTATFADLGSGANYGSVSITAADNGATVSVPLSPAAITALNSALASGTFALGGADVTWVGSGCNDYIFGFTGGASDPTPELILQTVTSPVLSVTKSHTGDFTQGQTNAQYTITVSNSGAPTSGTVTVTDTLPTGLVLTSMSGTGWTCTLSTSSCTRGDPLGNGASYLPLTVTVSVASNAAAQVTNQVSASGGGSAAATASDLTHVDPPVCAYSFSNSPATAGPGTSTGSALLVTSLTNCPYTSVVSNNPTWIAITSGLTGNGSGPIGYSIIAANNSGGSRTGSFTVFNPVSGVNLAVATFTIVQSAANCSALTLAPNQFTFGAAGGSGTVNFNTSPCSWSIAGNPSWVTLTNQIGTGSSFNFTVAANPPPGTTRQATLSINNGALTVMITQTGLVCTYTITDAAAGFGVSRSFTSSGGGGGINVAAPAGCAWTATPSQSFITISGNATGNGNGGVSYSVAPNSSSTTAQTGTIAIAPGLAYLISELPVGSPSYTCSATALAPAPIRPEGFAERVADVVFTCGGQAPAAGASGDVRISFNAGITNLLLSTGQTDALLLEDEPTAANLVLGTNAFRGVLTSGAILFPGVQLAPVGGGTFSHTWRIVNPRVNAKALAAGTTVQATVSITATAPFTVSGQPSVATVASASSFLVGASSAGSPGQTIQPVSFTEGFATAFEPKVLATQDPSQPGTAYNSESGFVNTAKLGAQTGFATNGTRLITAIANVPTGVSVYAPAAPASGTNAEITSADATGSGGFPVPGTTEFNGISYQQVVLTGGAGAATWEVTASDPAKIETLTFNLLLVNPNGVALGGITYANALAPVSAGAAPQLPSTTLPVPRFASSTVVVAPPATVSLSVLPQPVTPGQGATLTPALRSAASTPSSTVVGGTVSWTQVQANTGAAATSTAPNVTVGGTLPPTWVITGCTAVDSAGVCPTIDPNNPSGSYTVTYPSLSPGQTGTIMLTAQSGSQNAGSVEYSSSIDSDLANSDSTGDSFTTNFPVSEIELAVTVTHGSNFQQGQTGAQYTVTVTNGGNLATSLPVTVTETLPAGLTLVSMGGTGWTCTVATSSCTTSNVLMGNSSFPSITVTVNVASNAPSPVTNQVTAATGVLQATGSDVTTITPVTGTMPAFFNGEDSLGSGVYYLKFPDGNLFGYYNPTSFPIFYHYDMGFEAFVDGGSGAAYLYDFTSGHWWYTSSSLFPYLYDFTLNNWLYYFPATNNPGHYTSNPRYFSNLTTGKIITM